MDLYSVLQLRRDCSKDEIKKAYRNKAVQHHPDRHANASKTEQDHHVKCFREASEAHDILSSDLKREVYNRSGRSAAAKATASNTSAHSGYGNPGYGWTSQSTAGGFGNRSTYTGHGYAGRSQNSRSAYQQQPRRGIWDVFRTIATRSSRGDALFHALLASCLVGGTIIAAFAGDRLWKSHNRGRLFEDVERDVQQQAVLKRLQQQRVKPSAYSDYDPEVAATVQHHPQLRQQQQQQRLNETTAPISQPRPMQNSDWATYDSPLSQRKRTDGSLKIDEEVTDLKPSIRTTSCEQGLPLEVDNKQAPSVGTEDQRPQLSVSNTSALRNSDVAALLQSHDSTESKSGHVSIRLPKDIDAQSGQSH